MNKINVVGAGLAGSEASYMLARNGFAVTLYDIKPHKFTPASTDENFCELVCSNSLKGKDMTSNACGLLKEEMRVLGSLTMQAAAATEVPAGGALAVDREKFAKYVTERLREEGNIEIVSKEVESLPEGYTIICTGPLTVGKLNDEISRLCGGRLAFYDASAPIVAKDSLDFSKCFFGDRYGKGGDDYINCPMNKEEYENFVDALLCADKALLHDFERGEIFEGCMPIEVMAARGRDSLRFANLKPVGLFDESGNKFYAVVQLRKENEQGSCYNLVGFQTNLKFPEQRRVFSMIPALKNAEFLRYGVMHRNTFINSPSCLDADFSLKGNDKVYFAGQITGVEGYVESAASGMLAAIHLMKKLKGEEVIIPDDTTIMGALTAHICRPTDFFQPMNANFGILREPEQRIRNKKERYAYYASRAIENINKFKEDLGFGG